ncbi:ABC transporter ATP-binding protein [Caulobacter zeae]|uniref:ABC transporter ATP-binding protein n=1 Tax=Caulobacter zeae TaxID=2055137 RepID=A0A2N5D9B8_9CAUL|nr:ATP-binding cassette domain-containing protein [Caulobacter zeae]PLR22664.1 ABC transporter ATP-binding protein [Caulobacter zeae]
MTQTRPKFAWKGVIKRFEGRAVLDGLNLSVAQGRSLVIIGGSGQGKSVAIKTALGLLRPDAGQIELDGHNLVDLSQGQRRQLFSRVGVLFQGAALFDSLTVWENVAFRLINADGVPRKAAKDRAIEALDQVRLGSDVAHRFPSELSGGMQKRAGLARAVVGQPEILFFDEPTTGLDPITAMAINQLISDQVRRLGSTAISITHDLVSAQMIGDEIAMLHEGRIRWRGLARDLGQAEDPVVRRYADAARLGPVDLRSREIV